MLEILIGSIRIMRATRHVLGVSLILLMAMTPWHLSAYPGFGKRMNPELTRSCSTCHVTFPKLTAYGRSIREMGYNVPVYLGDYRGANRLYHLIPAALRGKVELANGGMDGEVKVRELQLLSGGNLLNNRLSWWFHKHVMEDNQIVSLLEGVPHESWVQFNASDALHVRIGMSELPLWFSPSKTKVSEIEYLTYGATTNPDNFGSLFSPQLGIQVNGHLAKRTDDIWAQEDEAEYSEGYSYAVALTNGEASFSGEPTTLFARITRKDPRYAAGLFAVTGWKEAGGNPTYRIGADGDVYLQGNNVNLFGSVAYGKDLARDFAGGFVAYEQLFLKKFFVSTRYDLVKFFTEAPPEDMDHHADHGDDHNDADDEAGHGHGEVIADDASSLSLTFHYLFLDNLRLGVDYRYGFFGVESKGTLQLQFGF